jgi:hypothetical protein
VVLESAERHEASWGPWQAVMEESIAGCMAQLRKLDEVLTGEGLGSVDKFYRDAMHLYHLANELPERCEDIIRWQSVRSGMETSRPDDP